MPVELEPRFHHFKVGTLACTTLSDGSIRNPRPGVPRTADASTLSAADVFLVPLACLAVKMPDTGHVVLMDSGFGYKPEMLGKMLRSDGLLLQSLQAAGIAPASVDVVLISHLDPDHVGGLYNASGQQTFPNATYYASEEAVRFWSDEGLDISGSPCPPPVKVERTMASARVLECGAKALKTFRAGDEVLPGIGTIALPGHAPGQVGFRLSSEGETLTYTADAIANAVISVQTPHVHNVMDLDPHVGVETRHSLLHSMAESRSHVFSPHFPFPNWGRVEREGDAHVWKPGGSQ